MSIDERLRASLHWEAGNARPVDAARVDPIVSRATRRRRIRVAAGATVAAAVAVVVAIAASSAVSRSESAPQPIMPPTKVSSTWAPSLTTTPIDEHWVGSGGDRDKRLATLEATGLAGYGPALYAKYFAKLTAHLQFGNGDVEISTTPSGSFLGADEHVSSLHGTFSVRGHSVAMRFEEPPLVSHIFWPVIA